MRIEDILGAPRQVTNRGEILSILQQLQEATGRDDFGDAIKALKNGATHASIDIKDSGTVLVSVGTVKKNGKNGNGHGDFNMADILGMLGGKGGDVHAFDLGDAGDLAGLEALLSGKRPQGGDRFADLMSKLHKTPGKDKKPPAGPALAIGIGAMAVMAGAELLHFEKKQGDGVDLTMTQTLIEMIEDVRVDEPDRFERLSQRVAAYGLGLAQILAMTKKAVDTKRVDHAHNAAEKLGFLIPVLFAAVEDANEAAKKEKERLMEQVDRIVAI